MPQESPTATEEQVLRWGALKWGALKWGALQVGELPTAKASAARAKRDVVSLAATGVRPGAPRAEESTEWISVPDAALPVESSDRSAGLSDRTVRDSERSGD